LALRGSHVHGHEKEKRQIEQSFHLHGASILLKIEYSIRGADRIRARIRRRLLLEANQPR
jgi:hypothetical protein